MLLRRWFLGGALAAPLFAIKLKKSGERKKAPAFELQDAEGRTVKLSDYAGKVVLVDFWATWCVPCKESIPLFHQMRERYGPKGFEVIGIAMDAGGWKVVRPFAEEMKMAYPVVLGTPRVAYLYGDVEALPLAFLIDREQKVAAIHLGAPGKKELEKAIESLLAA
ncbi:MAG: TlpA disulfide reductase family protein [Bryobacteraceae bacterium]|nr:TlpA disulfide reductase family protein [Bryobacteraceae bacterium]